MWVSSVTGGESAVTDHTQRSRPAFPAPAGWPSASWYRYAAWTTAGALAWRSGPWHTKGLTFRHPAPIPDRRTLTTPSSQARRRPPAPSEVTASAHQPLTHSSAALILTLAALASARLLAFTNKICLDVAPVPFLWVFPLAIYLLSFILTFEYAVLYRRVWFMPAALVMRARGTSVCRK